MIIFIIVVHVLTCMGLIGIVLIQRGRGGGLVESFSGVESMFGTKTSSFLTRATTVLSISFFITCLSLAAISLKQSRSLMRDIKPEVTQIPVTVGEEQAVNPQEPVEVSIPEAQETQEATKSE